MDRLSEEVEELIRVLRQINKRRSEKDKLLLRAVIQYVKSMY